MPTLTLESSLELWRLDARCRDEQASLTPLFFSEAREDIAAAKIFCRGCAVRSQCLDAAIGRAEPIGVWGGELFLNGRVITTKRPRGRPPKSPRSLEPDLLPEVQAAIA